MKFLFVINNLDGGGAERTLCTLASYLAEVRGYDVSIVVQGKINLVYPLSPKVKLLELKTGAISVGYLRLIFVPLMALELVAIIRRARPDSVMSFLVRSNFISIIASFFCRELLFCVTEMCNTERVYSSGLRAFIIRFLIARLYPLAGVIVAISSGVKSSLINLGIKEDKIKVIFDPQDIAEIKARVSKVVRVESENLRLVMAGRLVPQKDYSTMLHALRKVVDVDPNVELLVLGDGPLFRSLISLTRSLNLERNVIWNGWTDNIFEVMATRDVFVLTSRFEGFGNVILEAMACGLPVISTDCPSGPNEILDGGVYGILVPVGDSNAVAHAILKLKGSRQERNRYGSLSIKRAPDFDVSVIADLYLEVLSRKA